MSVHQLFKEIFQAWYSEGLVLSLSQAAYFSYSVINKYFQLIICLSAFINDYVLRQYCEIFNYCLVMW
jgi:hypothetical protein